MATSRSLPDPEPPNAYQRGVIIASIVLAVLAACVFVAVLFLGGTGSAEVGRVFTPVAVGATVLGLTASVAAIVDPRTRPFGIASALVLVPCAFLSLFAIIALTSG